MQTIIKAVIRLAPAIIIGLLIGVISGVVSSVVITAKAAYDGRITKTEQLTAERAYGSAIWGAFRRFVPFLKVE